MSKMSIEVFFNGIERYETVRILLKLLKLLEFKRENLTDFLLCRRFFQEKYNDGFQLWYNLVPSASFPENRQAKKEILFF